jgi:aspartyl-tRNA(Asn)/glutamyl-tRNA(Gln) amidotransferase subunit B
MAHDYRYFPDPDLMPVNVDEAWKAGIRAECPELPFDKQRRFFEAYQLPYTITAVLIPDRGLCDYFEEAARLSGKPQAVGNWIANDLLRELGAAKAALGECRVRPAHIAGLVKLVEEGVISSSIAREVFVEMFQSGELPVAIVGRKGLKQSTDVAELERWCADAIAANPKSVADFKGGKENAINAMKGFVMKQSKGNANPRLVDEILRGKLAQ